MDVISIAQGILKATLDGDDGETEYICRDLNMCACYNTKILASAYLDLLGVRY